MTDLADICGRATCTLLSDQHQNGLCPDQGPVMVMFLPYGQSPASSAVATFVHRHPYCCPRCGWHISSHGGSHGQHSDCPSGARPPAVEDGTASALNDYLTFGQLIAMAKRRVSVYLASQQVVRTQLGAEAGIVGPMVLDAYREAYPTDQSASDARAFAAFSAGFDAGRRLR